MTATTSTQRIHWKDYELADGCPLLDDLGDEAPKLDVTAPLASAEGYLFCNSDVAATLFAKYAGKQCCGQLLSSRRAAVVTKRIL